MVACLPFVSYVVTHRVTPRNYDRLEFVTCIELMLHISYPLGPITVTGVNEKTRRIGRNMEVLREIIDISLFL